MGDAVDKYCLQNPLDIVKGVTHADQAAKGARPFRVHVVLILD